MPTLKMMQATRRRLTEAELSVAFALRSGATSVVVGTSSTAHFEDAIRGGMVDLTDEELRWLSKGNDESVDS